LSTITADLTQHYGLNGAVFDGSAGLGGDASRESWVFGSTDDRDNNSSAMFDPNYDKGGFVPLKAETVYIVSCKRAGHVVWRERFTNLVTTAGLTKLVDSTFGEGNASPAWFLGLIAADPEPNFDDPDTMDSHEGWEEEILYTEETRPAFVPGSAAAGAIDNGLNRAVFHIDEGVTSIAGFFLADESTKEGTTGTLYGEGVFSGGVRQVEEGDILRVAATIQLT
jgi:hypothetical protein